METETTLLIGLGSSGTDAIIVGKSVLLLPVLGINRKLQYSDHQILLLSHYIHLKGDPDKVAFCVLAAAEEDEGDIALQIHFTLIQAFCCDNDIDIVRLHDIPKLADIVGPNEESGEPRDLHCILITNPNEDAWKDPALEKLNLFCEESRNVNDWVPTITLPE
ncbi:Growth arrest and DNA damage-inducible protein GADD45 gamma [Chelonia mydas]|uniref:Growth arrest and DNA damage-inducible protein GADD45 gamma n=1 Tax=Chelonia mydas TaxID=8469 RepID=M7BEC3_CHEMY|nr:Growth arrest and DNA damage-inducible protein GADD45 gamma [Chelonia mydas]